MYYHNLWIPQGPAQHDQQPPLTSMETEPRGWPSWTCAKPTSNSVQRSSKTSRQKSCGPYAEVDCLYILLKAATWEPALLSFPRLGGLLRCFQDRVHPCTCWFPSYQLPRVDSILSKVAISWWLYQWVPEPYHRGWLHRPKEYCGQVPPRPQHSDPDHSHHYGLRQTLQHQPWWMVQHGLDCRPEQRN